jgi:hypothetical protein
MKLFGITCLILVVACCSVSGQEPKERWLEPHEKWLSYMAGEWTTEQTSDGQGDCIFVPCGKAKALTFGGKAREGDFAITGVIGWHGDYKMFVETNFQASGARAIREYTKITDEAIIGTCKERHPKGVYTAEIEYRRISEDEMHLRAYRGDKELWKVVFERKK